MELRHLRYFVAIGEEENYRRAAQRLNVAQGGEPKGSLYYATLSAVNPLVTVGRPSPSPAA